MSGQNERTPRMSVFSGTGNARRVARWMAEAWRERNHTAEAVDPAGVGAGTIEVGPNDDIGLASPTHGLDVPPITLAFLFRFPRTTWGNRVRIVNTRAGARPPSAA